MSAFGLVAEAAGRANASGRQKGLALAAVVGEAELERQLDGGEAPATLDVVRSGPAPRPGKTFLERVSVEGFRGVGPLSELELAPGPGLTLVVGRNGCGKSSLAEAAEYALTGHNARWESRSKVWRDGWRNLHTDGPSRVAVQLRPDGEPQARTLEREWSAGADLDASAIVGDRALLAEWEGALATYRPFLPYSDLGVLVDRGPTQLHDTLSEVLGLGDLTAAAKRLKDARLARSKAWKAIKAVGESLAEELDALDDGRASTAASELRRSMPDLDRLGALIAGSREEPLELLSLRQVAALQVPDATAISRAAEEVKAALADLDDATRQGEHADLEIAELLELALQRHERAGTEQCPVCGTGTLDDVWVSRATQTRNAIRGRSQQLVRAKERLRKSEEELRRLVRSVNPPPTPPGLSVDTAEAVNARDKLVAVADLDPREAAAVAGDRALHTAKGYTDLQDRARERAAELEDAWHPFSIRLGVWHREATEARRGHDAEADLRAAQKLVESTHESARADRWAPIADHAKNVWERLRQGSNVDIAEVTLAGSGNRRRVDVTVAVDGVDGAALSVMSQGELHALALSLFLPRAMLDESPFGFLIIDDPVQSMDPLRVDGLARVLGDVASTHQVVVFTHDDRLPAAIRRLDVPATILEVHRSSGSRVQIRSCETPASRYLSDADALARSADVPPLVRGRAVPGFLRLALESHFMDLYRRRASRAGTPQDAIEQTLDDARTLMDIAALGIFAEKRTGAVLPHLNSMAHRYADALRKVKEGAHSGVEIGELLPLIADVRDLMSATT